MSTCSYLRSRVLRLETLKEKKITDLNECLQVDISKFPPVYQRETWVLLFQTLQLFGPAERFSKVIRQ